MSTTKKNNCEGKYPERATQKPLARSLLKRIPSDHKNVLCNPEQKYNLKKDAQLKEEKCYTKRANPNSSLPWDIREEFKKFHLIKPLPFCHNIDELPSCHDLESCSNNTVCKFDKK